jgi:hypothetical protein
MSLPMPTIRKTEINDAMLVFTVGTITWAIGIEVKVARVAMVPRKRLSVLSHAAKNAKITAPML